MARSASIASMSVTIRADTNPFTRALRQAQQSLGKFGKQLEKFATPLKFFGGALASISFTHIIKDGIELADSLGDASARIGIAANKLLALQDVAGQADVSIEQLRSSLQKMTANITGYSADATKALEGMGLSIDGLVNLSADEQLLAIADAMSKLRTEGQRTAAAMRVFGRSGANMTLILAEGAGALRAQMEAMGAGPSASGISAADRTNDALTRGRQVWDRFKIFLGVNASRVAVGTMDSMDLTRRRRDEAVAGFRSFFQGTAQTQFGSYQDPSRRPASSATSALSRVFGRVLNGGGRRTAFNQFVGNLSQLGGAGAGAASAGVSGLRGLRNRLAGIALGFGLNPDMSGVSARGFNGIDSAGAGFASRLGMRAKRFGMEKLFQAQLLGKFASFSLGNLFSQQRATGPAMASIGAVDASSREGFSQRVRAMRDDPLLKVQREALNQLKGINRGVQGFAGMQAANFAWQ